MQTRPYPDASQARQLRILAAQTLKQKSDDMDINERFGQLETTLAEMLRHMDRQSEQIDDIIKILKISDARQTRAEERQTRAEERQDLTLAEIKRMGDRIDRHSEYIDLNLRFMTQQSEISGFTVKRTEVLERQMPAVLAYETRFKRLEDAVFAKAS